MERSSQLLDYDADNISPKGSRPVFLSVLCILTFVGVGFKVLSNGWSLWTLQNFADQLGNRGTGGVFADASYYYLAVIMSFVGAMLCLTGAIMMWKLKKAGYYIYIVGQLVPLIVSYKWLQLMMFNWWSILISILIPVVFIVLYGVNYRHFR